MLIIAISLLQFILEKAQEEDWFNSPSITVAGVISFFAFYFFIWREFYMQASDRRTSCFKNKNLSLGRILSFALGFEWFCSTLIIPLYTQTIMSWMAFQAGMVMIPSTIFTSIMMPIVGKMIERGFPFVIFISFGMVIFFYLQRDEL